jgi:hypothetical protein
VGEKKKYNYYLPKCPDSGRKPLAEKKSLSIAKQGGGALLEWSKLL